MFYVKMLSKYKRGFLRGQNKNNMNLMVGLFMMFLTYGLSMQCSPEVVTIGAREESGRNRPKYCSYTVKPDVDVDDDGLIEIYSPEELCNIHYNPLGTSWKTSASDVGLTGGCPPTGCRGYELMNDIDFANTKWGSAYRGRDKVIGGWDPIGGGGCVGLEQCNPSSLPYFSTTFRGNNHSIRNLYIDRGAEQYVGLFGVSFGSNVITNANAIIDQVNLDKAWIRGGVYSGGLIGFSLGTVVSNTSVDGVISSGGIGLGLLAGTHFGTITNCHTSGEVFGADAIFAGGLVGYEIDVSGDVTSSKIENSYSTAKVLAKNYAGGLLGKQAENNTTTRIISSIRNSYATGSVSALDRGGINVVGGLVGAQYGNISNSYATGSVSALDREGINAVGGLVGAQYGNISNSYATGLLSAMAPSGSRLIGALVGLHSRAKATTTNSYWDTTTTGIGRSAFDELGVTGLTTAEMQATSDVVGPPARTFPSGLGACFKLTANKYPQLYTWDASLATPACTTTLLDGPNDD